jgi:hypothetical protein
MAKLVHDNLDKKIDTVIELLRYLVALELSKSGASRGAIGKHIHTAKAQVVKMLRDVKKE